MRIMILSLILPIIIFHKSYNESTGYIMISYTGDVSKPYPIVIFDHFGNPDTTYFDTINLFFIHKFQVKERELLDLKQTIQQREIILKNDTLRDALAIRLVIDEQDDIIFIKEEKKSVDYLKELLINGRNLIKRP